MSKNNLRNQQHVNIFLISFLEGTFLNVTEIKPVHFEEPRVILYKNR